MSESETPPPYRKMTEKWFEEFREETRSGLHQIRTEINVLDRQLQDARMTAFKHDEQIAKLAIDLAETDKSVATVVTRVNLLDDAEKVRTATETMEEKSIVTKVRETVILTAVGGFVAGCGMFIWYLVTLFVHAGDK